MNLSVTVLHLFGSVLNGCESVQRTGIADVRNELGYDSDHICFVVTHFQVRGGVGRELRFTAALRGDKAEGQKLPLREIQSVPRVVVTGTIVHEPEVYVAPLLRSGTVEVACELPEYRDLSLNTGFQSCFGSGLSLRLQRQRDAERLHYPVRLQNKGEDPRVSEVRYGEVDYLFD